MNNQKVTPISFKEVVQRKSGDFDTEIITAINNLLLKKMSGAKREVYLTQNEILKEYEIACKDNQVQPKSPKKIFEEHLLDIEHLYRAQGWKVIYDKPGWNENYEAHFIFSEGE